MAKEYDLVIIGGGSAGLVVASAAAQLQAKVALIERERLGGDCLWYGCVPSKSLLHCAHTAYTVKNAPALGINYQNLTIDFAKTARHIQGAIADIEPHDSPARFQGLGVEVIFGGGEFSNRHTFRVNDQNLTARAFVIATGSRPSIPNIPGLREAKYLTNQEIFSLNQLPNSIAVLGAGPVGCELGQALARLGVRVTLIAKYERILPQEDAEAVQVLQGQLQAEGISLLLKTEIDRVEIEGGKKILFSGGQSVVSVDEILIATGRVANVDKLNLEAAGVEYTPKAIQVNQKLQTTNKNIYACGDVIGGYRFTHVAGYEATVVLKNALFFPVTDVNYRVIPWATFTQPELARVGLTETEARRLYGEDVCVFRQDFSQVDRAVAEAQKAGFAKIITRKNGEILGAHLVGAAAGELISEIVLAMSNGLKISALSNVIHIYPTLSEVNSKAALQFTQQKYRKNLRLQHLLAKFFSWRRRF